MKPGHSGEAHPPIQSDRLRPVPPPEARPVASPIGRGRMLSLQGMALPCMAVWPLLGMAFDPSAGLDELILLLGSVTSLATIPVMLITGPWPDWVLAAVVMLIWMLIWLAPAWFLRRRLRSWGAMILLLSIQSFLSLIQAGLGSLMWLTRDI